QNQGYQGDDRQWCLHKVGMVRPTKELHEKGQQRGKYGDRKGQQSSPAKKVQRFSLIRSHELYRDQIENDFNRARQSVFGFAHCPRMMLDWNFGHARAGPGCVDGYEAMHLAVEFDILDRLAPVGFQRATVVM